MGAGVVQHAAPTRRRWGHAQTEKAHGRFREDRSGHPDGGLHNHRLNDIGKDVADDHAQIART